MTAEVVEHPLPLEMGIATELYLIYLEIALLYFRQSKSEAKNMAAA